MNYPEQHPQIAQNADGTWLVTHYEVRDAKYGNLLGEELWLIDALELGAKYPHTVAITKFRTATTEAEVQARREAYYAKLRQQRAA